MAALCEELRLAADAPAAAKTRTGTARAGRSAPVVGEERRNEVDGTVLLYVPEGEYALGSEDISAGEKPVHRVILSPFWIAKCQVTNEQYGLFMAANKGVAEPAYRAGFNQPEQPVVGVSWEEAQAYCR